MQITRVGQQTPESLLITYGVLQDSILGPLLLTLYINDLPLLLAKHKSNLYADDTTVMISGCSTEEVTQKLNLVLDLVSKGAVSINCH